MSRRVLRVGELIRDELSVLLQRKVQDPRLRHLVSITRVSVSKDLKQARVFVSTVGSEEEKEEVLQGLNAATSFLRRSLGETLDLRYTPGITFHRDDALEKAAHVLDLMDSVTHSE
jgi:ribosome-binding factor A